MTHPGAPKKSGRFAWFILLAAAALFGFGLFQLISLRYEVGDVYPPYSSLRSDPLGVMAFYESLARMPGVTVEHDFSANDRLPEGKAVTYLHLAGSPSAWTFLPAELAREIDGFLVRGNRLVITFPPEATAPRVSRPGASSQMKKSGSQPEERGAARVSTKEKWGLDFGTQALARTGAETAETALVKNQTDLPLPATLDWHSPLILKNLDESWRVVYARGSSAVMAERKVGAGSLVLATDSYFLSNEALTRERHADLLAWLVGPAQRVVFDEAHFGVVETSGVAVLMRQYHLQWLGAGLLLLAGLFVWKNSFSFIPAYPEEADSATVTGKETTAGMVNLLRRNIPARDVLGICFKEWTRTLGKGSGYSLQRVDQAQAVLEREQARARVEQSPVEAYREVCRMLKGKP